MLRSAPPAIIVHKVCYTLSKIKYVWKFLGCIDFDYSKSSLDHENKIQKKKPEKFHMDQYRNMYLLQPWDFIQNGLQITKKNKR